MRFNEVIQQLSEDFDPIKRQHLDDLISQYRDATDPIGYDDDARDPDEVIAQIRQEFGDKIADDLEQGPSSHFPRDNHSMGYDSLKHSGSPRVTKSGKVNRQDVSALKGRIQQRAGSHAQPTLPESGEDRSHFIRHNIWTVMDGDEEVMQHPVEGDPFFSAKKFIRDLDDEGYEFTHVVSPEGKVTYLPHLDPRNFPKDEVDEGSQRVDSLVTDALRIIKGPEVSDAVLALKTVLGDREYNSRRGHYNFYVRQIMDMHNKQGVGEGYSVVPGFDKEKYQERPGLEGPFHTKSGKVVYYDKKEGSYYDPDTDMFISYEDWQAMNEEDVAEESKGLWANIHAKRERIKNGSGERMRKPGSKGAPTADALKKSATEGVSETGFGRATGRAAWDSNMPGYQGDYGGAENWGRREREDDEHHEIDRRQEQQAASGTWYITIDGKLLKNKEGQPFTFVGKAAATKAARTMMAKPFNQGKKFMLTTKGA